MRIGNMNQGFFPTRENRGKQNLQSALIKLAAAQRINSAADDAAGLAIAEKMGTQIRGFKMAGRNVQDGISALNVADGAAGQIGDLLQRQRELALQSSNGILSDSDRGMLDLEYQQINQEITRITEQTQFNGQQVLTGSELASGDSVIAAGADGEALNLPAIDTSTASLGIEGTSIATAAGTADALSAIDRALETVNNQRSAIGAQTNRFASTIQTLQTAEVNTAAAESLIRDQDMALGIMNLTRQQLLNSSSNRTFSMFNRISSDHILRLLQ